MSIQLKQALETLRKGQLIVYPTDTLYALGADAYNQDAIEAVFRLKRRPFSLPLPSKKDHHTFFTWFPNNRC